MPLAELPLFFLLAFAGCYYAVRRQEAGRTEQRRWLRPVTEVSVFGATAFWVAVRAFAEWCQLSRYAPLTRPHIDASLLAATMSAAVAGGVVWVLAQWRLSASLPYWSARELPSRIAGVVVLVLAPAGGIALVATGLLTA